MFDLPSFLMGQTRPLLGTQPRGGRMDGADESIEL